ncbi:EAL domain-containing protein [Stenotrophomonas sp. ATCM1_4]|uniref:EAL domain-containing protein n=1 Tax=Stenotrophomonas capsici TaxID=3110230 RepID=A0ABU5V7F4_9GAMM|nr:MULTISPECIES: EAL domain-containing protein [unclassified Stenotrophomonas]MBD9537600.1 EAL domain-containing protein [Stenotrophomonas sp. STM01]MEA5669291.1 EAL domain-containing protein [Stenotrophomonas sp. MH1]TDB27802.1 EAL domain-containing protein [Stenotrophomonas sp. ATCM1_4]
MQNAKDITLRLLIVDDSAENAEAIVSTLRNSGIAVRPFRPQSPDELVQAVGGQPLDLVLAANAYTIPQSLLTQQVAASGKDIPMILLADQVDAQLLLDASANGIRAIALRTEPDHLLSVVRTEWTDLQARRGLRRIEVQMRETERRCDALISSSRDPIAYIHEGMHIRANEAYLDMFGYESFDDVEGISLLDMVAPQYVEDFKNLLKSLSKGEAPPPQYEVHARNQDGDTFPATMEFTAATYEGESCFQVVFRRREEFDPELAREVEELRQRDQVTGLLNRPTFMVHLENAVAQVSRSDGQYGFLLVEPDHYNRLLADIGLDSADALIAALGQHLAGAINEEAQLARFGEHSFALLCQGQYAHTTQVAERVRQAFASHVFSIGQRSATVTVSIGGVQVGEKIASVGQVLSHANDCNRAAIELGGNTVKVFDPGATDRVEEERIQRWVQRIGEAIAGDGFHLRFRPVLNLMGEPMQLYDTSLLLENNGELVSPGTFLPIAEDHGLLAPLNRWVVANAIRALGERRRAGHTTRLMVRITPESFTDPQLLDVIRDGLANEGVDGDQLWLQIPEAKVFTHLRNAQQFLAGVATMGCKVGLEQFGSGLDSFQLLAHFQPAFLKLDRSFTADPAQAKEQLDKTREITGKAQEAGILTVAEFVTDAATMSLLFSAGVDYVQGDFVGPPTAQMDFEFN